MQARSSAAEPRYRMLDESGESELIRQRHAEYFVSLAEATEAPKHCIAGRLAWIRGEYSRASTRLQESLQLYEEIGDDRGVMRVLKSLGGAATSTARGPRGGSRW